MTTTGHLEDYPRTRKWLATMVIVSPLNGVVGPLANGLFWLINWGDPNYLLSGVILQAVFTGKKKGGFWLGRREKWKK